MKKKTNNCLPLRYKPKKSYSFGLFLLASFLFIFFVAIGFPLIFGTNTKLSSLAIPATITVVYLIFILWIWFSTFYTIEKEVFTAKSGPFCWKIRISDIREIRKNQRTIAGIWKPSLSWTCIEINYGAYRSISVSPFMENEFIDRLCGINGKIVVK